MSRVKPRRPTTSGHHALARVAHLHHLHLPAALLRQLERGGPLESPWVVAGLTGLAALNVCVGYVPTLPDLLGGVPTSGRGGGSRVVELSIGAPDLDVPSSPAYVSLPRGYDDLHNAARRYPVVYLLHGYPGGPTDWFRAGDVRQVMDAMLRDGLVQPMIVVTPDATGGWLHDSEMLNQVHVDRRFRTAADRAGRAVGGMSSGGYGALNLGLRHPMAVDLLAGSRDPTRHEAGRLAGLLKARGQHAVATVVAGANHTWRGARAELPYALMFASQHLTAPTWARPPLASAAPGSAGRP